MTSHYARSIRQFSALHDAATLHGEPLTLDQAAVALGVKPGSVEGIIDKLRRQGYCDLPRIAVTSRPHGHVVVSPIPWGYVGELVGASDLRPSPGLTVRWPATVLDDGRLAWLVM